MTIDNAPLAESEIMKCAEAPGAEVPVVWIGDDGDWAITPGHEVDAQAFASALGCDVDAEVDSIDRVWMLATPHRDGCHDEDLAEGETCGCDDYAWWASFFDTRRAGAFAVTRWRS